MNENVSTTEGRKFSTKLQLHYFFFWIFFWIRSFIIYRSYFFGQKNMEKNWEYQLPAYYFKFSLISQILIKLQISNFHSTWWIYMCTYIQSKSCECPNTRPLFFSTMHSWKHPESTFFFKVHSQPCLGHFTIGRWSWTNFGRW